MGSLDGAALRSLSLDLGWFGQSDNLLFESPKNCSLVISSPLVQDMHGWRGLGLDVTVEMSKTRLCSVSYGVGFRCFRYATSGNHPAR